MSYAQSNFKIDLMFDSNSNIIEEDGCYDFVNIANEFQSEERDIENKNVSHTSRSLKFSIESILGPSCLLSKSCQNFDSTSREINNAAEVSSGALTTIICSEASNEHS